MKLLNKSGVSLTVVLILILGTTQPTDAESVRRIQYRDGEEDGAVLRFNTIVAKCSDKSIEELKTRLDAPYLISPTMEEKCFIKCFFEYIGLVVDQETNYIQLLKTSLGEEAYSHFRFECGDFSVYYDQNPCEAVWQYYRCYTIVKRSSGITTEASNGDGATEAAKGEDNNEAPEGEGATEAPEGEDANEAPEGEDATEAPTDEDA